MWHRHRSVQQSGAIVSAGHQREGVGYLFAAAVALAVVGQSVGVRIVESLLVCSVVCWMVMVSAYHIGLEGQPNATPAS
jgi:hypothetical protein